MKKGNGKIQAAEKLVKEQDQLVKVMPRKMDEQEKMAMEFARLIQMLDPRIKRHSMLQRHFEQRFGLHYHLLSPLQA